MFSPSPHSARLSERAHADWIGIVSIENENGKLYSHSMYRDYRLETIEPLYSFSQHFYIIGMAIYSRVFIKKLVKTKFNVEN